MRRKLWIPLVVACFAAAVRVAFALRFPVMHYGDGYARLIEPWELVKSVWLPGYQATLAAVALFTLHPDAFRWVTMLQGSAAAVLVAMLGARLFGPVAGIFAGATVAALPTFVLTSTNLYQESLLIGLSAGTMLFRLRGGYGWLLWLVAACLTRYEAWLLAGFLVAWSIVERDWRAATAATLGPVLWLAWNVGISPLGAQSINPDVSLQRIVERVEIVQSLVIENGGLGVLLLGFAGLLTVGRRGFWLAAIGAAHVIFLAWADPYSSPDHHRQIHIPLVLLALLGGAGLDHAVQRWGIRGRLLAVGFGCAALLTSVPAWQELFRYYPGSSESLAASVGVAVRDEVAAGASLLVLSEGIREYPLAESNECIAVRAWAQDSYGRVDCDHEADDHPFQARDIVLTLGQFQPWRPVQMQAQRLALDSENWVEVTRRSDLQVWISKPKLVAVTDRAAEGTSPLSHHDACRSFFASADRPRATGIEGNAVAEEPSRLAFYSRGSATFVAAHDGSVSIWVCGTEADGRRPEFQVSVVHAPQSSPTAVANLAAAIQPDAVADAAERAATHSWTATAGPAYRPVTFGPVFQGDIVTMIYEDDLVDKRGRDRNLFVGKMEGLE